MIIQRNLRLVIATFVVCLLVSCSAIRYVPDGEMLLNRVAIEGDLGHCSNDELMDYVRQQPNVRVLGFWRINLNLYNLAHPNKDNWWSNWLRRIGSPPVIYDSVLMHRSRENLRLYLESCGYFDSEVVDTMYVTGEKKCKVVYNVDVGKRYRISSLGYNIEDDSLREVVLSDTINSLLRPGDPFDANTHDQERDRISRRLNDMGYYHFDKEYVYYLADSSYRRYWVSDSLILLRNQVDEKHDIRESHRKSVVDEVTFMVNRVGESPLSLDSLDVDSLISGGFKIYYRAPLVFKPELLYNSSFIRPGGYYSVTEMEQTQMRFNSLKLFNSVSIRYVDLPGLDSLGNRRLSCLINLNVGHLQSYSVDVEGTNSSGNLGGAANVRYSHSNLFKGAEVFGVKYRIASQAQFAREGKERFYTFETGAEVSLKLPKFIAPYGERFFPRRNAPVTQLSISYDYQRRPDFTKSVVATKYSYTWRESNIATHTLTPLELNIVNIPHISPEFQSYIDGTYLQYSYINHFIMSFGYTYLFNQRLQNSNDNAWYLRFDVETAGNLLSLVADGAKRGEEPSKIWGIGYAQYFKTNVELRYQLSDFWQNKFVYRLYAGVGIPYGNSQALPFEKSYFVGGANSIRAWPVRGLGPGSSVVEHNLRYHNQTSDIRLELNAEYRFKVVDPLEGAIFADAGNIWALPRSTDDVNARFGSEFYKQIALGAGLGVRLNFNYFVIRFDAAVKLHDPSQLSGERWVIATKPFKADDVNYNFAIGYPF